MKKNVAAIVMSFVLAVGNLGVVPVRGAETVETSAEAEAETAVEDIESADASGDSISEKGSAEQAVIKEEQLVDTDQDEPEDQAFDAAGEAGRNTIDLSNNAVVHPENGSSSSSPEDNEQDTFSEEPAEPVSVTKDRQNSDESSFRKEGMCGDNVKWILTGTNPDTEPDLTLTISGEGDMYDLSSFSDWTLYNEDIGTVVIEEGVTSIGDYNFSRFYSLQNITIPDTVARIGNYAFYDCGILEDVDIPDNITSIGNHTFESCGISDVDIPDNVTSIGEYAFFGCRNLQNIEIPDSVTSIGDYAFGECSELYGVYISKSISSLGNGVFYRCYNLSNVIIPDNVTSIGDEAFYDCVNLVSITIPNKVTSIGD